MSLITELRKVANEVPSSHIPVLNEIAGVVGALVGYVEHGDTFLQAAQEGGNSLSHLLEPDTEQAKQAQEGSPEPAAAPHAPQSPAPQSSSREAELEAELASLRQQLATRQAVQQRSEGQVEPGEQPFRPSPSPPAQAE